jgi:hypothetical protein
LNASGQPALNFTGNSRYAGTEIDAGLRDTILPGSPEHYGLAGPS